MQILPFSLLLCLLFVSSFCHVEQKTVHVVGTGECADCTNIDTSKAFSGLGVRIECRAENGLFKTRGAGSFDKEGKFKVTLPAEMVREDGELEEECFAQMHSASAAPCAVHGGLESSRIVSDGKQKHIFVVPVKLKFSPATCTSEFLWPFFKFPPLPKLSPFPKIDPFKKKPLIPKVKFFPPFKGFGHPPITIPPKKQLPPLIPKPKVEVPIYKPKPKPKIPIYKPKPEVPLTKKLFPPLPKLPSLPKLPAIPKIPLEDFHHHHKFKKFLPIPPFTQTP